MSQTIEFKAILDKNTLFLTYSRRALFEVLSSTNKPLSMEQLVSSLSYKINRSTVYRNIELFEKIGIVKKVYTGWKYRIELSEQFKPHHHHLTCTNCKKIITIEIGEKLEKRIAQLGINKNFVIDSHELELKGLCKNCNRAQLLTS